MKIEVNGESNAYSYVKNRINYERVERMINCPCALQKTTDVSKTRCGSPSNKSASISLTAALNYLKTAPASKNNLNGR